MNAFLAVNVVAYLFVCSYAASITQQDALTRNFIPDRYNIRGTLIHNDGTFTRQDPPPQPQADEQQQSMYDQFGGGQTSNLDYQQQSDYQTQDDVPYGQQSFQNQPDPNLLPEQNDQNAYYNQQQDLPAEQNVQTYADNSQNSYAQNDDFQSQGSEGQFFNSQPQEYQSNFNDQEPPEPQFQSAQPYFGEQSPQEQQQQQIQDYQPSSLKDDIQGSRRASIEKAKEKAKQEALEKRLGATKKYKIPKNISRKNLEGMVGYGKQIYLRGGH